MASNFPSISKHQIMHIIINISCTCFLFLIPAHADIETGTDTLLQGQVLREGEYLNSANKIYRLQFLSHGSSSSNYLGITYNADNNYPVWIANRDTPLHTSSLMLTIDTNDGLLKISHHGGATIVSNSTPSAGNTSATILDNGNLVLRRLNQDGSINQTLWQSFDYPADTFLPGMKLGINFRTGHKWSLTSWLSNSTKLPASGEAFTLGGDANASSSLVIWRQGNVYWTSGLWDNNGSFRNTRFFGKDFGFTFISNEDEKYLTYSGQDVITSPLRKFRIYSEGLIAFRYGESQGYVFSPCAGEEDLEPAGCVVGMLPECRKAEPRFRGRRGFVYGSGYIYDQSQLSLFDCRDKCRQNCSCIAFTLVKNNRSGCEIFDKVTEFRLSEVDGEVVYFLETGRARRWWVWLVAAVSGTLLLLSIFCYFIRKYFKGEKKTAEKILLQELAVTSIPPGQYSGVIDTTGKKMRNQVHVFSFESLQMATNNFCAENKLGEGGFGSVYKGMLQSGQEIAIKRLSRSSGQGLLEFKNEILLIAKLQHDNLVKLLGCCLEGQEKILVYEYMPNRSLDFFLFDASRRQLMKWTKRMNIIEGVAQGLLYLHKYSRLKVIHRDLKASNILLDQDMSPKISDFGMGRIFGKQESEANTNRIVGTHGYMSPEYAINGVFSVKSDVFSFGVLLLELVSGKKNHGCYHSQRPRNLIGLAWELWVEGRAIELTDSTLDVSNHRSEIVRCINVGLLCVQDHANDRPSMTDVITMLTNEYKSLPEPKQPAFFINTSTREAEKEVDAENACTNGLSTSVMGGR